MPVSKLSLSKALKDELFYLLCVLFVFQVGKSLLIKCLVKHYTKQNMSEVRGPITIVSGLYFCLLDRIIESNKNKN